MFGKVTDENKVLVVEGRGTPYLLLNRNGKWGLEFSDRGLQVWFDSEKYARLNWEKYLSTWEDPRPRLKAKSKRAAIRRAKKSK